MSCLRSSPCLLSISTLGYEELLVSHGPWVFRVFLSLMRWSVMTDHLRSSDIVFAS